VVGALDVAKVLIYAQSTVMTKLDDTTIRRFNMSLQRDVECFRQLAVQVERYGLSILIPPEPHSWCDIEFFLDIVWDLYWDSYKSGVEPYVQCIICRDELYITTLTSHVYLCNEASPCNTRHIHMTRKIALHLNSKSVVFVLNCNFVQEVVSMVCSNRQHVVLFALDAVQVLLGLKKKILRKVLKILRSIELGFGLAISNLLRQYASNGLRKMEICDCKNSFFSEKDCAAQCIQRVYQVIVMLHGLGETTLFPKCLGEDMARVERTTDLVTPFMGTELDEVYKRGLNMINMPLTVQGMRKYFHDQKLRFCDNKTCGKKETIEKHFKFCTRCKVPRYCSIVCQKIHWANGHKLHCFTVERG